MEHPKDILLWYTGFWSFRENRSILPPMSAIPSVIEYGTPEWEAFFLKHRPCPDPESDPKKGAHS